MSLFSRLKNLTSNIVSTDINFKIYVDLECNHPKFMSTHKGSNVNFFFYLHYKFSPHYYC